MKQCKKCKVHIAGNGIRCPLCKNVLSRVEEDEKEELYFYQGTDQNSYPELKATRKKRKMAFKIIFFFCMLAEFVLLLTDYYTDRKFTWSGVVSLSIVYVLMTLGMYLLYRKRKIEKLIRHLFLTIGYLVILEYVLALNEFVTAYGIPIAILIFETIFLMAVVTDLPNFQSYLPVQAAFILCASGSLSYDLLRHVTSGLFGWITVGITVFIFLLCVVFGCKKASREMKKWFMV